ncbi:VOC family protein [Pseudonocardia nematodicida]|uniref:VOC family protein n=1 Tax=Pseudonocardia nematodicida TaxID=1206997 RepID=A0ABV1KE24_9PSEU
MSDSSRQAVAFDHVGLNVADLDKAAVWYADALGLTAGPPFRVPGTDLRAVMLQHEPSGYRIELLHRPGARPGMQPTSPEDAVLTLGYGHFCLRVDDVRREYERLLAAGCSPRMEPREVVRPGALVSYVADPWGNLIEVLSR